MKKFHIGIQLYGVKNAMAADFEGTLRTLKDMGYDYVEFAGYHGKSAEEIKALLDEIGLTCVSVHQMLEYYDEDAKKGIDFLKTFGVKYSIIPWYDASIFKDAVQREKAIAYIKAIATEMKKNGMMLGYHNHDFEFEKVDGKYIHDIIMESVGEDLIFPEIDTCWVHYAGIRPEEKLLEFKGRVPVVHLKDFVCKNLASGPVYELIDKDGNSMKGSQEDNGFEFCPLGQGRQDFAAILKACEECGTDTVIVEQDRVFNGMTELEAAKLSRDYLKSAFGL